VWGALPNDLEALLLDARYRLEEAEDHMALVYVWTALGYGVANPRGRFDDWAIASEQALHHGRLAARTGLPPTDLGIALIMGSRPADEGLEAVDRLLVERPSPWLLLSRAWLLAMLDRTDEAWRDAQEAEARLRGRTGSRRADWHLAEVSSLLGDHEDASKRRRIVCDWLESTEQLERLASNLSRLGCCRLCAHMFVERERVAAAEPSRRQLAELPPIAIRVTEHRLHRVCWPGGAQRAVPDYLRCDQRCLPIFRLRTNRTSRRSRARR
jgi:hypothetical protein